jgi:protein-S-isoprenylcysteine O-methyltransferase Ste14
MSHSDDAATPNPPKADWLISEPVTRLQRFFTRLRFLLALPAAAAIITFTDHAPMWPGVAIALFGEAIQVWASAHLRKNVEVVMSGPYAWARNPMYLGRFFVGLGLTVLTWRWFLIVPYVIIFWLYAQARVLGEEARLLARFGDEYQAYCCTVRRWLPLPPRKRFSDARWSWECLLRNHELRVAVGVVLGLVLLRWRLLAWGPLSLGR